MKRSAATLLLPRLWVYGMIYSELRRAYNHSLIVTTLGQIPDKIKNIFEPHGHKYKLLNL